MKALVLSIIFSLLLGSCSQWGVSRSPSINRLPASNVEEITYYLSVDKFKYYINEYSVAQEGKIPDPIITYLRMLDVKDILDMNLDPEELKDAANYDKIITTLLHENNLLEGVSKTQLKWNYNFFKNKLNEAFSLSESKLDINLSLPREAGNLDDGIVLKPENLNPEEMTLDSGHYISNRTTRAIFWEANENNRPIEFHLGDSREFLKELKDKNGEILFEVKPFAKNYNKIYIIQYPGEKTYRYAITNIGGKDRLDHLTHQISLSNISKGQLKAKVLVKGDIKKFHEAKATEHAMQLRLLPKANRVIIGQKESIDGKFNLFWKVKALKNLYDEEPDLFEKKLTTKDREKLMNLMKGGHEALFKDKKIIEDTYLVFESSFEKNPELLPAKFKMYNYDNFTIEMCDYVFENENKETIRWRVISNVWGDEVVPIAQALKETGHTSVTYMGTAGAFANKGYKVGDLVIPDTVRDGDESLKMLSKPMAIEGARNGGSVEHVGSPFEESQDWLKKAQARSDFVEVETSYLRRIFNGTSDKLEIYLLISDILGSDTETLAHATSSKRKNAQNKLLAKLFERDAKSAPTPANDLILSSLEKNKKIVMQALEKKTASYRYYIYSMLKNHQNLTEKEVIEFAASKAAFTDSYILDRLVKIGEVIHYLKKNNFKENDFEIAFSKSLVEGTWNPKEEKIEIVIKAKNAQVEKSLKASLESAREFIDSLKSFSTIDVQSSITNPNLIWLKLPEKTDPDFLVKIYSHSGYQNAGFYKNVTYNGNVTFDFLPTSKVENPLKAYYQGKGDTATKLPATGGGDCAEAMRVLMKML